MEHQIDVSTGDDKSLLSSGSGMLYRLPKNHETNFSTSFNFAKFLQHKLPKFQRFHWHKVPYNSCKQRHHRFFIPSKRPPPFVHAHLNHL